MAKSQQTFNKKEKEKKKIKKREDKERKKEERKANSTGGDLESMLTYVDENGNFSSVAPDPTHKKKIKADQIQIGVPKREASDESETVRTGKVTFFNSSKGYGFIKDERTDENVFVHINGVQGTIKENDKVSFQVEKGPRGLNAIDVKVI